MRNIFFAFLGLVIFGGLFIVILSSYVNNGVDEFKSLDDKYKEKVGTKFILEKDTLSVIDYSLLKETFTLSNGVEVNSSLILNQKP